MNFLRFLLLGIFVFTSLVEGRKKNEEANDDEITDEARLYQYLTDKYDRINPDRVIIPVYRTSETQSVNFGMAVISFLDFDPDSGIGVFNIWERYQWRDPFLTWNPDEFGFVDNIRMPISQIWTPDIVLFNSLEPEPKTAEVLCVVYSDGSVTYIPRVQHKILCQQPDSGKVECVFKFASWAYDGFRLDLDFYDGLQEVDVSNYIRKNDYTLVEHGGKKTIVCYPCCVEPYPDLTFTLTFEKAAEWWEGKK